MLTKIQFTIKNILLLSFIFFSFIPTLVLAQHCNQRFELSTKGRHIIDACGNKIKFKALNWYGAHDFPEVAGGLDKQPLKHIVRLIKQGGFNSVRLTFSNHMLHQTNPVHSKYLTANPEFIAKTPLEIFDIVIQELTRAGLMVILNNHTTTSEWCCGFDFNGLWHHPNLQSTEQWMADWLMLVSRYEKNRLVVGVDLRNEVRTTRFYDTYFPVYPNWGSGDENDWMNVATKAGDFIHELNPRLLIIVEGINWFGMPFIDGYRPLLQPIQKNPILLKKPNKLVYEIHVYPYTGPNHTGNDHLSFGQIRYKDMSQITLYDTFYKEFAYVLEEGHPYTTPVWLGEFGVTSKNPEQKDQIWFQNTVTFLIANEISWAYWALNPQKADGTKEDYGLLTEDWSQYEKDWRTYWLQQLLKNT